MHPQTKIAISGIQNRMRDTSVEMNDQPALKRMLYDLARATLETNVDADNARAVLSDLADGVSALSERLEQNAEAAVAVPLSPVRWEYLVQPTPNDESHHGTPKSLLDIHGSNGWELVSVNSDWNRHMSTFFFKRPRATE